VRPWIVRPERRGDEGAIRGVIEEAFAGHPHSDGREPAIVDQLRAAGDLAESLIAESAGDIVGHVAFSPVVISDGSPGWFGLGPLSVLPSRQSEGIGSGLVWEGFTRLRRLGAQGCVVLGDPEYYARFGFAHSSALTYPGPPPRYFLRLVWGGPRPAGEVRYAAAFR
jgi:putative acetyltransferase